MLRTVREQLRFGREIARERHVADFVPYAEHVDAHTIRTKDGDFLQVIRLEGLPFETRGQDELDYRKDVRNTWLRGLASARMAVYHHVVRRRVRPDLGGSFPDAFSRELDRRWRERWAERDAFVNEHYVTLLRRPVLGSSGGGLGSLLQRMGGSGDLEAERARDARERKALEDAVASTLRILEPYGARRLSLHRTRRPGRPGAGRPEYGTTTAWEEHHDPETTYSEVLEFFSYLLEHAARPVVVPQGRIDRALPTKRITFGRDALEIRGAASEDRTLGAMLGIKEYGPETAAGMLDGLLRIPHELVLTESFAFVPRQRALSSLALQGRQMRNAEDEAITLRAQLEEAADAVASGEVAFGEHHLSVLVTGPTLSDLDQAVSDAAGELTNLGILAVREDLNLEPGYWAQLPGNLAFVGRRALVSSANFAGFASFHAVPRGRATGHRFGSAVTYLETTSATPFAMSFHHGDVGNFTVIGPSGSGKTVVLSFLLAQAQRFAPRSVFFDKDRGAEIFIRALGGAYQTLCPGGGSGMNPLALPDSASNRAFLRDWLGLLVRRPDAPLEAEERQVIAEAVDACYEAPPELRQLSHLQELFRGHERGGRGSLWARLAPWFGSGDRAWLFDHKSDELDLDARTLGFGLTHLLEDPVGRVPALAYLFHRVDGLLDGTPTLLFVDEGWKALDDPLFEARLRDWMKTVRKRGGLVGFGSQSASDALDSRIADTLREQCPTQLFFPNPKATEEAYCGGFGLSPRELELVRTLPDTSRCFLLKQGTSSVVARLDLGGMPDVVAVLSGRTESVALLDRLRAELGDEPEAWLEAFMGSFGERVSGGGAGAPSAEAVRRSGCA